MTATAKRSVAVAGGAGVIAAAVAFTPGWEGMQRVAQRDMIGTGHPVTYCYGMTSELGDVKVGTKFTKQQCGDALMKALPKYLDKIDKCIKVDMPDKTKASLLDAAWNAGPAAVCRSPMVIKMNNGDLTAGCNAFDGWYVRSDGEVRPGLIDRRAGEKHGDHRLSERGLCLEGLREGNVKTTVADATPVFIPMPSTPAPACEPAATTPLPLSRPPQKKTAQRCRPTTWWDVVTKKENKSCL